MIMSLNTSIMKFQIHSSSPLVACQNLQDRYTSANNNLYTQEKRSIGLQLYPKIQVVEPRLAGKITGMLLGLDNTEILVLLKDHKALITKVNKALAMLKDDELPRQERQRQERRRQEYNQRVIASQCSWLLSLPQSQWEREIGKMLFPKIQVVEPRLAGKITAMLLKMDRNSVLELFVDNRRNLLLMNLIDEALAVLKTHQLNLKQAHDQAQAQAQAQELAQELAQAQELQRRRHILKEKFLFIGLRKGSGGATIKHGMVTHRDWSKDKDYDGPNGNRLSRWVFLQRNDGLFFLRKKKKKKFSVEEVESATHVPLVFAPQYHFPDTLTEAAMEAAVEALIRRRKET